MKDARTESLLNSLNVKFEYIAEFPMSDLVSDPSTQVRREENRAPKPEVDRYFKLLRAGADFPPILVTKNHKVIDGNTRWYAYDKAHRSTIPVYRCDLTSTAVAKRIGVEMNAVHGKRMEKAELTDWLAKGNGSVSQEDAQRLTGWSPRTVTRVREALKFDSRRAALNVATDAVLPEAVREALVKITDPKCFRAMTLLADEAGLASTVINGVAREINEMSLVDPTTALAKIDDLRGEYSEQIEEHRAGMRVSTPFSKQLALHVGWLIKQGADGLHDTNPYTTGRSERYLQQAAEVVTQALARYGTT